MRYPFSDLVALASLLLWPAIPLFWIPVHCIPRFFRRLGFLTYILLLITWLPIAFFTFTMREVLLEYRITLPGIANVIGTLLLVLGAGQSRHNRTFCRRAAPDLSVAHVDAPWRLSRDWRDGTGYRDRHRRSCC